MVAKKDVKKEVPKKESKDTKKKVSKKPSKKKVSKKMKFNIWKVVSLVLIVLFVAMVIVGVSTRVSKNKAEKIVLEFAAAQGVDVEVVKTLRESGVYKVIVDYQGSEMPIYITCDGKNLVSGLVPFEEIFAETAPSTTDNSCYQSASCDLDESVKLMDSVGIDSDAVLSCVDSKGDVLYQADSAAAQSVGVTGSPSLVINGVKVSTARTEEAYFSAVCSAFTDNVVPAICSGIERDAASLNITQTAKPKVGLYIWSYCPYGITAQTPFAKVAESLDSSADFKIYTYYAGHGDFELQQNQIQACIQDLGYGSEYWEYSQGFVNTIYPLITSSTGATTSGSC